MTAAVEGVSWSSNRPSPAHPPSTPVKEIPTTFSFPLSDDSSPLSSLRPTPSLLSFDNEEVRKDNERIKLLSYGSANSNLITTARQPLNKPTDLPTPTSSPISLLDLNKRLLEGTIYQDRPTLIRLEAPDSLAVSKKRSKRSVTVSRFFAKSTSKKPKASEKISCIPFPPLHATSFGLVQERLSHDPFRLLVAVIFLNKTRGSVALPVFYQLMERYPTPADLAAAKQEDVVEIFQHLGLQNQRAKKCINLAKAWLDRPPEKGKRYRVLHYPKRDDGKDVRPDEIIGEEDERVAWEIGQLPGIGVYAIDSWRIFCRDELRNLPSGLPSKLTPEAQEEDIQKEWAMVLAGDKELRAYLRWRWLRNGWDWDPVTGVRKKADESKLAEVDKGGVIYEGNDGDLVVGSAKSEGVEAVKADLEDRKEDTVNEDGEADDAIANTKVPNAAKEESEETEATTADSQGGNDTSEERQDITTANDELENEKQI